MTQERQYPGTPQVLSASFRLGPDTAQELPGMELPADTQHPLPQRLRSQDDKMYILYSSFIFTVFMPCHVTFIYSISLPFSIMSYNTGQKEKVGQF